MDDLRFLIETEVPADAARWLVGFGFGGVLALVVAAGDDRVAGVACLGTPARPGRADAGPGAAGRAVRAHGRDQHARVSRRPPSAWAKELAVLRPEEDAELLKGRPLLVVHGADDPDVSVDDARALSEAATGPSDLRVVFGAGHWLRADPRVIAILVGLVGARR